MQYNLKLRQRDQILFEGNVENEYVPSETDLARLKQIMVIKARKFRREHNMVHEHEFEIRRDTQLADLKSQVLDLQDKFDYFLLL